MQLRLEPVQPYSLFPPMTTTTTTNNTTSTNSNSTSSYYPQQQHSQQVFPPLPNPYRDALLPPLITTTTTNNNTTKRLSAFEPVIASNHNSNNTSPVTPSPPPIIDDIPRLADFASSIIYLMWHARKKMSLKSVNQAYLIDATKPSPAFKKFCLQVLTATQLSQNAVYLALKYICALLRTNPSIEGADGSEYRLFTVALMLANKFLDDSTFTNKTWSDVSGMKLHDLNTMEAEFLEAIGYGLFIREYEFDQWRHSVDGCRAHVQRMAMMVDVDNTALMKDVLIRLGLYQETLLEQQQQHQHQQQQQHQQHQQHQHVWEAAFEASRLLQLENNQRQHNLNLYAKAHSLVPLRPQRYTAPPPPISRYGDPPFHYYQQQHHRHHHPYNQPSQQQRRSSTTNPPGLPAEPMYKKQLPPPGLNTSYYFEYRPFESSASCSWATAPTTTNQDYYL